MEIILVIALTCAVTSLAVVQCQPQYSGRYQYGVLKEVAACTSKRAATANGSGGGPRSPLLEIVFRILDTIQIVPKKRSRRYARSSARLSPLFGSPIFSARARQPLMALSLESSESAPYLAEEPMGSTEEDSGESQLRDGRPEFRIRNDELQLLRYVSSTSERFYDMVLGVLQVLENQARQEVHRARLQQRTDQLSAASAADEEPTT